MKMVLNPENIRKMDFSKVAPLNDKDLAYFLSANLLLCIKNIVSIEDGTRFSIKETMESDEHKIVFACMDFDKQINAFVEDMDTKLERKFITKKSEYVFFDKEEQRELKKLFFEIPCRAAVQIMRRKKSDGTFDVCPIQTMSEADFKNIFPKIKPTGVKVEITLDEYMRYTKRFHGVPKSRINKEEETLKEIFQEFPDLKQESKAEVKKMARLFIKDNHPDGHVGEENYDEYVEKMTRFNKVTETLYETNWYKELKEE